MVISLAYTPPFLAVERARETAIAELSVTMACDEAHSCSALQGEGSRINEGPECVQSENAMQFRTTTS